MLAILVGVFLVVGSIILYRSYAFYEEKSEYNVIKGQVGDFSYDVKLAIVVDGQKKESAPTRGLYKTNVECSNGTTGEWDYNDWTLNLENIESNSKCNVTFTSNLTQAEYNTYLEAGIAAHRTTYRGKDITSYYTNGSLYTKISNGSFEDIYVGDYFTAKGIKWLIADLDNYLYTGDTPLTKHHATIIPAKPLTTASMNAGDTTQVGYAGSKMVTTTLPSVLSTYITPAFGSHVIEYRSLLSNQVTNGVTTAWQWATRKLDLMSEVNVFGATISSSSFYDVGIDNKQFAIFSLKPELINTDGSGSSISYWLKSVINSAYYTRVNTSWIDAAPASSSVGVRPRFLVD